MFRLPPPLSGLYSGYPPNWSLLSSPCGRHMWVPPWALTRKGKAGASREGRDYCCCEAEGESRRCYNEGRVPEEFCLVSKLSAHSLEHRKILFEVLEGKQVYCKKGFTEFDCVEGRKERFWGHPDKMSASEEGRGVMEKET